MCCCNSTASDSCSRARLYYLVRMLLQRQVESRTARAPRQYNCGRHLATTQLKLCVNYFSEVLVARLPGPPQPKLKLGLTPSARRAMFIDRLRSDSALRQEGNVYTPIAKRFYTLGLTWPSCRRARIVTLWSYKQGPPGGGPELQTVKSLRDFTLQVSGPTLNHIPPGV